VQRAIHIVPGEHQDWIVKEEAGRELGHYPSRAAAETVGHKLARKRKVETCDLRPCRQDPPAVAAV
jgi:Uncharacterized protein conserved in bacteria (DUF2188)